jgi:hypothetical protein
MWYISNGGLLPCRSDRDRRRFDLYAIIRSGEHGSAAQPQHFGFDQLLEEQGGFHLLAEEAGEELVLGFIGRWWDRGYGRVEWSAEEFRDFSRPGYAVGAWGFTVLPYGSSTTVLVTDVRVRCTDEEARRSFQRYWTAVVTAMGRPFLRLNAKRLSTPPNPSSAENRLADILHRDSRSQHRPGLHHRSGVNRRQLVRPIPVPLGQPPRNGFLPRGGDHMVASHATSRRHAGGEGSRYALQQANSAVTNETAAA